MTLPRWRRRGIWGAAAAVALAVYALAGFFLVPRIVRAQIEKQAQAILHRPATLSRVRFNPFTLAGVVEGLDLKDRDGAELFHVDRLTVDFQVTGIFRRAWKFREIVVEGPHAVARVVTGGRLSIADLFEEDAGKPAEPASAPPRVIIDRFSVKGGAAEFVDETRSPRFVEGVSPLDLELHDLTTIPDESGDHTITLGLGEGARVRWSGRQTVEPLHFEGNVGLEGIGLSRIWEYVGAGNLLEVRDGKADVRCAYDIKRRADGGLSIAVKDVGIGIRDLAIRPRTGGEDWLAVPLVEVEGGQAVWPESRVEVRAVRVHEPHALAWIEKDGTVSWQGALPPAASPAAAPASPATPRSAVTRWTATVGTVEISKASAHFEDRSFQPPIASDLTDVVVKLENVSSDLKAPIRASLEAHVNGAGTAGCSGTIVAEPPTADLDVQVRGLDLKPFAPYAIRVPNVDLRRGAAGLEGKLHFGAASPKIRFDGGIELTDLQVAGPGSDRLVACDRATLGGATVTLLPEAIRVAKIQLDGAFVKLDIDRDGNVNLKKIFAAGPAPSDPLHLDIGSIAIHDATADYTDESVILPFGTKIHAMNGTLKDLSTTSPVAATLALEGRISEAGYFKADGTMRIAAPEAATDVRVIFRGVDMPELTPYSATFAGYSIEKGSLDVDIRYRIQNGRLVGDHRVVAKDLTLGSKVEGAKGPPLPVRLAVALLKDKDGRIDLEIPIEGAVDSPEFNYRSVFWQAVKTILGNAAKAPFRAIGRLFGADQDDLELVGFPSGQSGLPPPELERLQKLGVELGRKGELALEIEGRYDPAVDAEAIRRARLTQRIDAKREGTPNVETILESLYSESFSPARLEEERKKFVPAPPKEGFDAAGFYDALRAQLLAAEDVPEAALKDLARARASAIQAALTAPGGLDPARVKLRDPATVKRKKQGSELVASELTLSAGD